MAPRSIAHFRLPTRASASEVYPSNTYRSEKSAWQTLRHLSFHNKLQQSRARENLYWPGEGARTSCARARHECPHPLCESQHECQCFGSLAFSVVRTTVPSNQKMEASRLLQCSSVRILFVAQLMWLDMLTKVKPETLLHSTVFSAHVIEHDVRSTYMLKSEITIVIRCLKIHTLFTGLILVWSSSCVWVYLE